MRAAFSLLCLLGMVLSLACAAPHTHAARNSIQKRTFKVERVRNPHFVRHNTPRQLLKAHMKFGVRPPQPLVDLINAQDAARQAGSTTKAAGKGAGAAGAGAGKASGSSSSSSSSTSRTNSTSAATNSTAGASNAAPTNGTARASNSTAAPGTGLVTTTPTTGDVEYLSPVSIGGQTLNLDFDTGSSDLWVFNTQLPANQQTGHTLYNPAQSSSFQQLSGQTFSITYGDGSAVSGTVGTDTVNIGGATVTKQAVELATTVSASFLQDTASNGLLGLAYSKLNTVKPTQQKTFFDNAAASGGGLAAPVFTADLRHNAAGAYEFGTVDQTKFAGAMTYVPVNTTQGFWQFSSTAFAVGNGTTQTGGAGQAIADTGTTLLLANAAIVNAYYSTVSGAANDAAVGGVTVPCSAQLPDLHLDVGGTMATVAGQFIMFEQVQGNTCFGGLQAIDSNLMIFGDIFFKSNFVAFNSGNNSLGFAPHA